MNFVNTRKRARRRSMRAATALSSLTLLSLGVLAVPGLTRSAYAELTGDAPLPLLQSSPIVHKSKSGALTVASANGNPIDGVKVPTHDLVTHCPSIVVTPNGVIHIAFLQQVRPTSAECAIYYCSSSDGGKSWTAAKNLSEVMPDLNVGACRIVADAAGRVYVIWNVGRKQYISPSLFSHGSDYNNIVYRVLSGGQWSGKAVPVHQMASAGADYIGSLSYFVTTDSAGNVRVVWNEIPIRLHPEVKSVSGGDSIGGLAMEATLNGTAASAPREVYLAPVVKGLNGSSMDGLDMLTGYVDAADQTHILAQVAPERGGVDNRWQVIENGGQTPGVDLPGPSSEYWSFPPTLLVDAQGRKHIVTMYKSGEHEQARDYAVGSENEPTIVRSSTGTAGTITSLQAIQGPAGHMLAIMDMNDTGGKTTEELYVSTSSGGAWSPSINVTNNSGRLASHSTNTSVRSNVATMSWGFPGEATGTFDKSGHLLVLYVRNTMSLFGVNAVGVELAGGSTATPNLMFLRF